MLNYSQELDLFTIEVHSEAQDTAIVVLAGRWLQTPIGALEQPLDEMMDNYPDRLQLPSTSETNGGDILVLSDKELLELQVQIEDEVARRGLDNTEPIQEPSDTQTKQTRPWKDYANSYAIEAEAIASLAPALGRYR